MVSICATTIYSYSKTACGWWRQTQANSEACGKVREYLKDNEGGTETTLVGRSRVGIFT